MKKRKAGGWTLFLSLTLIFILILSEGMKGNEVTAVCNIKGFYQEEKNSLDAIVIGASEVYTSYSAIEAWENYGYTSYAYGCPGLSGNLYKTVLKEVLKKQSPQVLAIEINGFIHGDDYLYQEGRFRNLVDNLRWSENRLTTIRREVPEEERMAYYFPLMAYHSNWKNPSTMARNTLAKMAIASHGRSVMKGYAGISRQRPFDKRRYKGIFEFGPSSRSYLIELLEYCKEQKLEHVLFFRAPHVNIPDQEEALQEVWELIRSYGYDVLDLSRNLKKVGISIQEDFYNSEHLNIYGMKKVTAILAGYFTEQYGIQSIHNDKTIKEWQACSQKADIVFNRLCEDLEAERPRYYSELNVYLQTRLLGKDEMEE